MPNGAKWNEYVKKYQKEKCTRYSLILSNKNDNDIIDFFNSCSGEKIARSAQLKQIIRYYMKNNPNG